MMISNQGYNMWKHFHDCLFVSTGIKELKRRSWPKDLHLQFPQSPESGPGPGLAVPSIVSYSLLSEDKEFGLSIPSIVSYSLSSEDKESGLSVPSIVSYSVSSEDKESGLSVPSIVSYSLSSEDKESGLSVPSIVSYS